MSRSGIFAAGLLVLVSVWVYPLPALGLPPFSEHMTMHMAVVAVAAPLLSLGVAGRPADPTRHLRWLWRPIPLSVIELCVVWAWHAPALHRLARHDVALRCLEQGSFLGSGLLLWLAAVGGTPVERRARTTASVIALLLTSMHMTLLGALIALSKRPLYAHVHTGGTLTPLQDQQVGGAVMLLFGGAAYLFGGLALIVDVLRARRVDMTEPA